MPEQFRQIEAAVSIFVASRKIKNHVVVFQRFFASDICNQMEAISGETAFFPASSMAFIQQISAMGKKLVAWMYLIDFHSAKPEISASKNRFRLLHNGYRHFFATGLVSSLEGGSYDQTLDIFGQYIDMLRDEKMTLEANCVRTWIFVRDIDLYYQGMVKARNSIFEKEGLPAAGHFIASTGIEGQTAEPNGLVGMDAYAIGGIEPSQIHHLKGLSHLSPTRVYGVSFERGTAIDYGDRRHIFISGTASIDHHGTLLHPLDVAGQTRRVFENMGVLLAEAGASFGDVTSMIVYIRDPADKDFIHCYLKDHYAWIPFLVVRAPICRKGWLVEIECTATTGAGNVSYRNF